MATDFTEETAAGAVVESFVNTPDPRLRELLTGLVRHLHAFVRETEPTIAEWERAIEFLTATGQKCDDERQEFILLSDVLGISMLVETINNRTSGGSTESTVLGPFHVVKSPRRELGDNIDLVGSGTPCVVKGRVLSAGGTPLPGAELDVWQASDQGFYDVQQPGTQPRANGRGLFTADADGAFWFRTVVPSHYPIPTDGPVGTLLNATKRHPFRPAHIHFIVTAPGHRPLTTHIFVAGSPYIESDAVFAVKKSLIVEFTPADAPEQMAEYGLTSPFRIANFNIVLQRESKSNLFRTGRGLGLILGVAPAPEGAAAHRHNGVPIASGDAAGRNHRCPARVGGTVRTRAAACPRRGHLARDQAVRPGRDRHGDTGGRGGRHLAADRCVRT
jgi:catechol 1,2-dioxygenase